MLKDVCMGCVGRKKIQFCTAKSNFKLNKNCQSQRNFSKFIELFEKVIEGYKEVYPEAGAVLERFEQVKRRGRNKK